MRGARLLLSLLALAATGASNGTPPPLAPRHADFLATAGVLLEESERDAFLSLARDHRRDAFIARFWEVRDPYPDTVRNEARERFEARLAAAQERFGDLADPRARELLLDVEGRHREAPGPVPRPGGDWLAAFLERGTELPAGAEPLPATLDLNFAAGSAGHTAVETRIELAPGPEAFRHSLLLDGEILDGEELREEFRYRFEPAAGGQTAGPRTIAFTRDLPPGRYTRIVRLQEEGTARGFREEHALDVPHLGGAGGSSGVSLSLLAPRDRLLTGRVRLEARVRGEGIAGVVFSLDGREVMTKSRPPFTVEFDLGSTVRPRRVRAVARGPGGEELAADEAVLNGGAHRFAVRLRAPRGEGPAATRRLEAAVEVPAGETLDRVELYLDERRLATLYQPPFVHPVTLGEVGELSYLRAVAWLRSGLWDEALLLVDPPSQLESIDVDLVELFVTVSDRLGRPVDDLTAADFEVIEDGQPRRLVRFERLRDLPFHAALVVDTSGSMQEVLGEVERAAHAFLAEVVGSRARAAVIPFADEPRLAARFTGDLEVLAGALAGLVAEGDTRLWDTLAFGIHYCSGLPGKRALVVLTDGLDSGSHQRFTELLPYARASGVTLYFVGLGVPLRPPDVRWRLEELARATGGRLFLAARASGLAPAYDQLREELSSQYLLAFQARITGDRSRFRPVTVRVRRPGLAVRAPAGYAPRP